MYTNTLNSLVAKLKRKQLYNVIVCQNSKQIKLFKLFIFFSLFQLRVARTGVMNAVKIDVNVLH